MKRYTKPVKIYISDHLDQPCSIAFSSCGIWAVVDRGYQCVHIFNDKDQLIRKIGIYTGNSSELTFNCCGVAFDACNYLYVIDGNIIKKFDIIGNNLLQFGSYGSEDGQLSSPLGITTHNCRVYIADSKNRRISVFQNDGQFSHSFGSKNLTYPCCIVVNFNNLVLVANNHYDDEECYGYDYYNCHISVFTLDGSFLSTFGRKIPGLPGGFKDLCGLVIDKYGFIFVTDSSSIVVFDQHGNFIHSFGFEGSSMSIFKCWSGIALSPNGSIYVCNSKKIQIFSDY